jgi:hypothetical protein
MKKVQKNLEAMPVQDARLKEFIEKVYIPAVLAHPTNFEEAIAKTLSMGVHPWKGAVVGGLTGFVVGGPLGIPIGAGLGAIATKTQVLHRPGMTGQDVRRMISNINLVQYVFDMGLRFTTAVANASQYGNTYSFVGEKSAAKGYAKGAQTFFNPVLLKEVEEMNIASGVSSITGRPLLGGEQLHEFVKKLKTLKGLKDIGKSIKEAGGRGVADAALIMFQGMELQNRFGTYWAGKDFALKEIGKGRSAEKMAKKVTPETSSLVDLGREIDRRMADATTVRNVAWQRKTDAMRTEFAKKFGFELNEKTQFRVGRENLPKILNQAPLRLISPYKSFLLNQVKLSIESLSPKTWATDPKRALRFAGITILMGGALANPVLYYGMWLPIKWLLEKLFDWDIEKDAARVISESWMAKKVGITKDKALSAIRRGISGLVGLDISGSLAIQLPTKPVDILGRYGKLALELGKLQAKKVAGYGTIFEERRATRMIQPALVQGAIDALRILETGHYISPVKQIPIALTEKPWSAAIKRFLGSMPSGVADSFDQEKMIEEKKAKYKSISADLTERWATAVTKNDQAMMQEVIGKFVKEVNASAERLVSAEKNKNQDAFMEALTDLLFWDQWQKETPKFRNALERKIVPKQFEDIKKVPKYMRPEIMMQGLPPGMGQARP